MEGNRNRSKSYYRILRGFFLLDDRPFIHYHA